MNKGIIFLPDGMGDEPIEKLGNKSPLEAANTPNMDTIAAKGASGTFLTLPDGYPTSSDVANMSVLGYDVSKCYPGRGPLEAVSQGIELGREDIAWRCNLVTESNGILEDYSAGHIKNDVAKLLFMDLQKEFGNKRVSFYPGVSYRNLIVLHGSDFSHMVNYHKPDSCQGMKIEDIRLTPADKSESAKYTVQFLEDLIRQTSEFLKAHPLNAKSESPANMIWLWSPGKEPEFIPFEKKYSGSRGAVITAVDVISGIGICTGMDVVKVKGATGFIDTNYKGKADAAASALYNHELVYLHVEAIDECSHIGDLDLKMRAIEDFDSKIVGPVMKACQDMSFSVNFAVLPDHFVPLRLKKHTREPVPFAICGNGIPADSVKVYSEREAPNGALGFLQGEELVKMLLGLN